VEGLIEALAGLLAALSALAAAVGAWRWWQVRPSPWFWRVLRASQAAALALAAGAGVAVAAGGRPDDGLFWVYGLVPVVVGFVAEQLRVASAETVLEARGIEGTADLAARPDDEQRSVALAIVRREMGVMAVAAGVTAFLAVRAIGTAAGF
jgi:hypothetical protein